VRAEVEHHLLLATSENHRVGESGASGNDFDGTTASVVEPTPLEEPAVYVPGPVCDGAVYDRGPEPDEDHHGNQATALGNATDDNSSSDGAKLHLVNISIDLHQVERPDIPGRMNIEVPESMVSLDWEHQEHP
jgi:hypothetical protein